MFDQETNFRNFRNNLVVFMDGREFCIYDIHVPKAKRAEAQRVVAYVRGEVSHFLRRGITRLSSYHYVHGDCPDVVAKLPKGWAVPTGWYARVYHGGESGWSCCTSISIPDSVISGAG